MLARLRGKHTRKCDNQLRDRIQSLAECADATHANLLEMVKGFAQIYNPHYCVVPHAQQIPPDIREKMPK